MTGDAFLGAQLHRRFEIIKIGYVTLNYSLFVSNPGAGNWASGDVILSVAHNLSFVPTVMAFEQQGQFDNAGNPTTITNGFQLAVVSLFGLGSGASNFSLFFLDEAYADATNVYFVATGLTTNADINLSSSFAQMKYYLLKERKN